MLLAYETTAFCEIVLNLSLTVNNLNYNVIKHKLTSQDPCQIFHDFCHAKCENFWIMNKAKC